MNLNRSTLAYYDYIIVGAGPCGLTLAYGLAVAGIKCLLIDKNHSIGGCHRVTRVDGLFTEHGPRIYSTGYVNTHALLRRMCIDPDDIFVAYKFSVLTIIPEVLNIFSIREMLIVALAFIILIFNSDFGKNITMLNFMLAWDFSHDSKTFADKLCRMSDGASSSRYTLFQFLQILNVNSTSTIQQLRLPNDVGLFRYWMDALIFTGNVDIILESDVTELIVNFDLLLITGVRINDSYDIQCSRLILCIPPENIFKLLQRNFPSSDTMGWVDNTTVENAFGNFDRRLKWSDDNAYNNDIPIIFHWDMDLHLTSIWGFPRTEWSIVFIILTDYMFFEDNRSKTVISTCITDLNTKSLFTGKTANECDSDELKVEVFRQVNIIFCGSLTIPTFSLLYEEVYYDNGWKNKDKAFVNITNDPLPQCSETIKNLYNCGTHNLQDEYYFTSFETAVINGINLLHLLEPCTIDYFTIESPTRITTIVRYTLLCVFAILIVYWVCKYYKRSR